MIFILITFQYLIIHVKYKKKKKMKVYDINTYISDYLNGAHAWSCWSFEIYRGRPQTKDYNNIVVFIARRARTDNRRAYYCYYYNDVGIFSFLDV